MKWTHAVELMAVISARERREADAQGEEQPSGLAALHAKIARRVKGR